MKKLSAPILLFLVLSLSFPSQLFSENEQTNKTEYGIHRIYPSISLTKEELKQSQLIPDLNPYYNTSWIKEYVSVEIKATFNSKTKRAVGKDAKLTKQQKKLLLGADVGHEIFVRVKYIPDNNLKNNDIKEIIFSFVPEPEHQASFPGGSEKLHAYLKETLTESLNQNPLETQALAAVKFKVGKDGKLYNIHMFESSRNEAIDKLLLKTIHQMPKWDAASYANGSKVEQEFVLTVGNMNSCIVNLLTIHRK